MAMTNPMAIGRHGRGLLRDSRRQDRCASAGENRGDEAIGAVIVIVDVVIVIDVVDVLDVTEKSLMPILGDKGS